MTSTAMKPLDRPVGRRKMLVALGLVAGAAYVAPTMLQLSQARASGGSGGGSRGSGGASGGGSGGSPGGAPRASGGSPASRGFSGHANASTRPEGRRAGRADCRVSFSDGHFRLTGADCPKPLRTRRSGS
jgi:hypothetical protein